MHKPSAGSRLNVGSLFALGKYKHDWRREHPHEFPVNGILVFSGRQGSGKSLTAIQYIKNLLAKWPGAVVVSNAHINGIDYIPYTGLSDLLEVDNGEKGIILFFDEISNQFNSVQSKDISPEWFTILNMQRKRHMHIIGTCPILTRVGKAFREQFDIICICSQHINGYIQLNEYYVNNCFALQDGEDIQNGLKHYKWQFFFIHPDMFKNYDTFEVVKVVKDNKERNERNGYVIYD